MIDAYTQHAIPLILAWQRMSRRAKSVAYTMKRGSLITSQDYDEIERSIGVIQDQVPYEIDLVSDSLVLSRFIVDLVAITPCLRSFELENLFAALMRRAARLPDHTKFTMDDRLEDFLRDAQVQHWRQVITIILFTAGLTTLAFASNVPGLSLWGLAIGALILSLAFASLTLIRPWN